MRVFLTIESIAPDDFPDGTAVAIGKFDGVHLGHQAILKRLTTVATSQGLDAVAFTFANNPLTYLRPEQCPAPLMSKSQRLSAIEALGVSACVMVDFDESFANISAEDYVKQILVRQMRARHVIVGRDFRFGHRGSGDVALLHSMGKTLGFDVEVVESVEDSQLGRISSTAVRTAIERGDVAAAARMLGHPVTVAGEVVRGDARGRDLGFPTANLGGQMGGLVPADGVYAGWVILNGHRHPAAISIGSNPTFTPDGQSRVEAYILDFSDDIYGHHIEIQFVHFLRGMVAFAGTDELISQMGADVRQTRDLLAAEL